jgi:cysteine desulfurase/selenocysteine lyase
MREAKADFPALAKGLSYLDWAASAQKPQEVLDAISEFERSSYANVHRGVYKLAERATQAFEDARGTVARFIGAATEETLFTSGTTGGINALARSLEPAINEGDEILVSIMEHHSNFVPWQQLARRRGAAFKTIPLTPTFRLDLDAARKLITARTKVIAVAHVSNVLGVINPIPELAALARANGALLVVDGAQAAPHTHIRVHELGCDAYAFSAHKLYGPTGVGALWVRKDLLETLEPPAFGGEMVREVTVEQTSWNDLPWRFEPGTPPITQAIGFASAIRYIERIGIDAIVRHERELIAYALEKLRSVPGLALLGPSDTHDRLGVFSFTLENVHPHDIAQTLDERGIAIRASHHCAQPLHCALGIDASARASIGIPTSREDIDRLVAALGEVRKVFG